MYEAELRDLKSEVSVLLDMVKTKGFSELTTKEKDYFSSSIQDLIENVVLPLEPEVGFNRFDLHDDKWKINLANETLGFLETLIDFVANSDPLDKKMVENNYENIKKQLMTLQAVIPSDISLGQAVSELYNHFLETHKSEYDIAEIKDDQIIGLHKNIEIYQVFELHNKMSQELSQKGKSNWMHRNSDSQKIDGFTSGAKLSVNAVSKSIKLTFNDNNKPNQITTAYIKDMGFHWGGKRGSYWSAKISDGMIEKLSDVVKKLHLSLKDGIYNETTQEFLGQDYKKELKAIELAEVSKDYYDENRFSSPAPQIQIVEKAVMKDWVDSRYASPSLDTESFQDETTGKETIKLNGLVYKRKELQEDGSFKEVVGEPVVSVMKYADYFESNKSNFDQLKEDIKSNKRPLTEKATLRTNIRSLMRMYEYQAKMNLFNDRDDSFIEEMVSCLNNTIKNHDPVAHESYVNYIMYMTTVMAQLGQQVDKDLFYEHPAIKEAKDDFVNTVHERVQSYDLVHYIDAQENLGNMEKHILKDISKAINESIPYEYDYFKEKVESIGRHSTENKTGKICEEAYNFAKSSFASKALTAFTQNIIKAHDVIYENDKSLSRIRDAIDMMSYGYFINEPIKEDNSNIPHEETNMPISVQNYTQKHWIPELSFDGKDSYAMGHIEYGKPLSNKEIKDFSLKPSVVSSILNQHFYKTVHKQLDEQEKNMHKAKDSCKKKDDKESR